MSSTHSSTNLLFSTLEDNSSASCCCLSCSCSFVARHLRYSQIVTPQNCTAFMQQLPFSTLQWNSKQQSTVPVLDGCKPKTDQSSDLQRHDTSSLSHSCPQRKTISGNIPNSESSMLEIRFIWSSTCDLTLNFPEPSGNFAWHLPWNLCWTFSSNLRRNLFAEPSPEHVGNLPRTLPAKLPRTLSNLFGTLTTPITSALGEQSKQQQDRRV